MDFENSEDYQSYSKCQTRSGQIKTPKKFAKFQKNFIHFTILDLSEFLEYLDSAANFNYTLSGKKSLKELIDVFYIDFSDAALTNLAKEFSVAIIYMEEMIREIECKETRNKYLKNLARSMHIPLFKMNSKAVTDSGAIRRMRNFITVRKKLRKLQKKVVLHRSQCIGIKTYSSLDCIKLSDEQEKRNQKFLESKIIKKDEYEACLADITRGYYERFCEMNALNKVMDEVAKDAGYIWVMVTLTAPPEYHSNPERGRNSWNGATARDAHDLIHDLYIKSTKSLGHILKRGEGFWGSRVVEPHKSGTPHWHCLIYLAPENVDLLKKAFKKHFNWHGKHAVDFRVEDTSLPYYSKDLYDQGVRRFRSSGANYIIKYIIKNIAMSAEELMGTEWADLVVTDHLSNDKETISKLDTIKFVAAWRKCLGINTWGHLGVKGRIGLVREGRRLKQRYEQDEISIDEIVKSMLESLWNNELRKFVEELDKYPHHFQVWREKYTNEFDEVAYRTKGVKGVVCFYDNGELIEGKDLKEARRNGLVAEERTFEIKTRGLFSIIEKMEEQEKYKNLSDIPSSTVRHMVPSCASDAGCAADVASLAEGVIMEDPPPQNLDDWTVYVNIKLAA